MTNSLAAKSILSSSQMRWAVGGWSFFIAENLVLSENRQAIIQRLGDSNYHALYGMISTAAMASVGYGYRYKVRAAPPFFPRISMPMRVASFISYSLGLGLASQTMPKFQIPVVHTDRSHYPGDDKLSSIYSERVEANDALAHDESSKSSWKVRCPFDFTDKKMEQHKINNNDLIPCGVERITRHPGLWSFGLVCLGAAMTTPSVPQAAWLSMPTLVALVGGAHTDSRYRRGLGGNLSPEEDLRSSNVPFAAMLSQEFCSGSFSALLDESKGLNFAAAVGAAAFMVVRKLPR